MVNIVCCVLKLLQAWPVLWSTLSVVSWSCYKSGLYCGQHCLLCLEVATNLACIVVNIVCCVLKLLQTWPVLWSTLSVVSWSCYKPGLYCGQHCLLCLEATTNPACVVVNIVSCVLKLLQTWPVLWSTLSVVSWSYYKPGLYCGQHCLLCLEVAINLACIVVNIVCGVLKLLQTQPVLWSTLSVVSWSCYKPSLYCGQHCLLCLEATTNPACIVVNIVCCVLKLLQTQPVLWSTLSVVSWSCYKPSMYCGQHCLLCLEATTSLACIVVNIVCCVLKLLQTWPVLWSTLSVVSWSCYKPGLYCGQHCLLCLEASTSLACIVVNIVCCVLKLLQTWPVLWSTLSVVSWSCYKPGLYCGQHCLLCLEATTNPACAVVNIVCCVLKLLQTWPVLWSTLSVVSWSYYKPGLYCGQHCLLCLEVAINLACIVVNIVCGVLKLLQTQPVLWSTLSVVSWSCYKPSLYCGQHCLLCLEATTNPACIVVNIVCCVLKLLQTQPVLWSTLSVVSWSCYKPGMYCGQHCLLCLEATTSLACIVVNIVCCVLKLLQTWPVLWSTLSVVSWNCYKPGLYCGQHCLLCLEATTNLACIVVNIVCCVLKLLQTWPVLWSTLSVVSWSYYKPSLCCGQHCQSCYKPGLYCGQHCLLCLEATTSLACIVVNIVCCVLKLLQTWHVLWSTLSVVSWSYYKPSLYCGQHCLLCLEVATNPACIVVNIVCCVLKLLQTQPVLWSTLSVVSWSYYKPSLYCGQHCLLCLEVATNLACIVVNIVCCVLKLLQAWPVLWSTLSVVSWSCYKPGLYCGQHCLLCLEVATNLACIVVNIVCCVLKLLQAWPVLWSTLSVVSWSCYKPGLYCGQHCLLCLEVATNLACIVVNIVCCVLKLLQTQPVLWSTLSVVSWSCYKPGLYCGQHCLLCLEATTSLACIVVNIVCCVLKLLQTWHVLWSTLSVVSWSYYKPSLYCGQHCLLCLEVATNPACIVVNIVCCVLKLLQTQPVLWSTCVLKLLQTQPVLWSTLSVVSWSYYKPSLYCGQHCLLCLEVATNLACIVVNIVCCVLKLLQAWPVLWSTLSVVSWSCYKPGLYCGQHCLLCLEATTSLACIVVNIVCCVLKLLQTWPVLWSTLSVVSWSYYKPSLCCGQHCLLCLEVATNLACIVVNIVCCVLKFLQTWPVLWSTLSVVSWSCYKPGLYCGQHCLLCLEVATNLACIVVNIVCCVLKLLQTWPVLWSTLSVVSWSCYKPGLYCGQHCLLCLEATTSLACIVVNIVCCVLKLLQTWPVLWSTLSVVSWSYYKPSLCCGQHCLLCLEVATNLACIVVNNVCCVLKLLQAWPVLWSTLSVVSLSCYKPGLYCGQHCLWCLEATTNPACIVVNIVCCVLKLLQTQPVLWSTLSVVSWSYYKPSLYCGQHCLLCLEATTNPACIVVNIVCCVLKLLQTWPVLWSTLSVVSWSYYKPGLYCGQHCLLCLEVATNLACIVVNIVCCVLKLLQTWPVLWSTLSVVSWSCYKPGLYCGQHCLLCLEVATNLACIVVNIVCCVLKLLQTWPVLWSTLSVVSWSCYKPGLYCGQHCLLCLEVATNLACIVVNIVCCVLKLLQTWPVLWSTLSVVSWSCYKPGLYCGQHCLLCLEVATNLACIVVNIVCCVLKLLQTWPVLWSTFSVVSCSCYKPGLYCGQHCLSCLLAATSPACIAVNIVCCVLKLLQTWPVLWSTLYVVSWSCYKPSQYCGQHCLLCLEAATNLACIVVNIVCCVLKLLQTQPVLWSTLSVVSWSYYKPGLYCGQHCLLCLEAATNLACITVNIVCPVF